MSDLLPKSVQAALAQAIAAILIGVGSAYMTVQVHKEQIEENRRRIGVLESRHASMTAQQADVRERLVRLETKIDILLTGNEE